MEMLFTVVLLLLTTNLFFVMSSGIRLHKRYTEVDACKHTTSSLVIVEKCPYEDASFSERAKNKMCNSYPPCQGEELVFHCVRYRNGFAEVCAPKETIIGYCCAVFDAGLGRVREDYSTTCSKCPFQYDSTEAKLYSECYHIGNEQVHNGSVSNDFPFAPSIAMGIVALLLVFLLAIIKYK